jgi:hypothetical protein
LQTIRTMTMTAVLGTSTFLGATTAQAAPKSILIDDFSQGAGTQQTLSPGASGNGNSFESASIWGGSRTVWPYAASTGNSGTIAVTSPTTSSHGLRVTGNAANRVTTLELTYDGLPVNGDTADLTGVGQFVIIGSAATRLADSLTVKIFGQSMTPPFSAHIQGILANPTTDSAGRLVVPFSLLTTHDGSFSLSMTDTVTFDFANAGPMTISSITATAVPEPGSFAVLLGSVGLLARRRHPAAR